MTKAKRTEEPNRYGKVIHPGGRDIEIISRHQEWTDWVAEQIKQAPTLLRQLDDALDALKEMEAIWMDEDHHSRQFACKGDAWSNKARAILKQAGRQT